MVLGDVNNLAFKTSVGGGVNEDITTNEERPERMERGTIIEFESNIYKTIL